MFTWLKSGGDGFKLINWKRKKKKGEKKKEHSSICICQSSTFNFHITISSSMYEYYKRAFSSNFPKYLVRPRMIENTEEISQKTALNSYAIPKGTMQHSF